MSCVAIYSGKVGFPCTPVYNMLSQMQVHVILVFNRKSLFLRYCFYQKLALDMQINTYLEFLEFLLDFVCFKRALLHFCSQLQPSSEPPCFAPLTSTNAFLYEHRKKTQMEDWCSFGFFAWTGSEGPVTQLGAAREHVALSLCVHASSQPCELYPRADDCHLCVIPVK